jgi:signal transduction histidine kinase
MANSTMGSRQRKPAFLGLLIILPIILLAGLGVYSLRQDRASVEQEANQRAEETARNLAGWLERQIASELSAIELFGNVWTGDGIIGGSIYWPGTSPLGPDAEQDFRKRMEDWQADYPALKPSEVFPIEAMLTDSGELQSPASYDSPPSPPRWIGELSIERRALWNEIRRHDPQAPESLRAAVDAFLAGDPPAPVRANAEFVLLLVELETLEAPGRVDRLTHFARRHSGVPSESGLHLSNLALARALQESAFIGLTEPLFRALGETEWHRPSFITPHLMEQQEQLAADQSPEIRRVSEKLRVRWESQERLRRRALAIIERLRPTTVLTTNAWFDWDGMKWLALLNPSEIRRMSSLDGKPVTNIIPVTKIRFFPEAAVARAAERALADAPVRLPPYLAANLSLENRNLPNVGNTESRKDAPLLASIEGKLSLPGRSLSDSTRSGELALSDRFETIPSHPRFVLRLVLADPPLLYAEAARRARTFGALILAALVAAFFGLFKTFQALRRQQELSEMKSNFVSSVSHELRAPIASMRLMAEGLERGTIQQPDKQRDYFRFIVQECRRLSSLIENVLDFSRIEQGRKQYELEPTDVAALARETVRLIEPCARERAVSLSLQLDPRLDPGASQPVLDGKAIQQALINLIDNAIKHSPANSTVTVGLNVPDASDPCRDPIASSSPDWHQTSGGIARGHPEAPSFILWVQDHGEGIPPGDHERIFERFHRLGSELRRESQGAGIGLSIVKHIVDAHGGTIRVESHPGEGSRFILEFPMNSKAAEQRQGRCKKSDETDPHSRSPGA